MSNSGVTSGALAQADASAGQKDASPEPSILPCQKQRYAIEVLTLDASSKPAEGIAVELRDGQKAAQSKTGPDGVARFEGLDPNEYQFGLYKLDGEAWESADSASLDKSESAKEPPPWGASAASEGAETTYTVKKDECVTKLADRYGLTPETIWNANGELAKKRASMNILAAGDQVKIPARKPKWKSGPAGKRYIVRLAAQKTWLRVRFLDAYEVARDGLPYLLSVTTLSGIPVPDVEGETDDDGFVIQQIPADSTTATITLGFDDEQEVHEMHLSRLDPVETDSGLQARLNNLGYGCGEEDGKIGPATKNAIRRFQQDRGLKVTGEADDATRRALADLHLS